THKKARPRDADIVFLAPGAVIKEKATKEPALPLWTLSNVTAHIGTTKAQNVTSKLHTGFGLTDAYIVDSESPITVELWRRKWSQVKGSDGTMLVGLRKGFLEVVDHEC
ncbi:MAG: hypothetical protein ACRCSF_01405, partial [Mycobacteriaceae bacterium]